MHRLLRGAEERWSDFLCGKQSGTVGQPKMLIQIPIPRQYSRQSDRQCTTAGEQHGVRKSKEEIDGRSYFKCDTLGFN